jgi:hypothetical protein
MAYGIGLGFESVLAMHKIRRCGQSRWCGKRELESSKVASISSYAIDTQYVLLNQAFLIFNFLKIQRVFRKRHMLPIIILVHYYCYVL